MVCLASTCALRQHRCRKGSLPLLLPPAKPARVHHRPEVSQSETPFVDSNCRLAASSKRARNTPMSVVYAPSNIDALDATTAGDLDPLLEFTASPQRHQDLQAMTTPTTEDNQRPPADRQRRWNVCRYQMPEFCPQSRWGDSQRWSTRWTTTAFPSPSGTARTQNDIVDLMTAGRSATARHTSKLTSG